MKKPKIEHEVGSGNIFADIGLPNTGPMGPMVENAKGHTFKCKLVNQRDKNDSSIVYARLKPEEKKTKK